MSVRAPRPAPGPGPARSAGPAPVPARTGTWRRVARAVVAVPVAALVLAACDTGSDPTGEPGPEEPGDATSSTTPATTPATTAPAQTTPTIPPPDLAANALGLEAVGQFAEPVAFTSRPGQADLYVAERAGRIRRVTVTETNGRRRYQAARTPFLDVTGDVRSDGDEQGLLGLAFSSDGRKLYVHLTARPDGRTRILEYEVGETVDTRSRRVLLEVEQPAPNHNGGQLALGPDGYLYVGLGDGGGADDPDGNGQDTSVLLGKILRIDPEGGTGEGPDAYAIPAGNPFAAGGGRPEIWAYGLRNPWRFSFDPANGDLWIGDVGQNAWEEVDRLPATGGTGAGRGANLGWDLVEGSHPAEGDGPPGAVLPIHEYGHDEGCSVTGGFVYRGTEIPALAGTYLFADFCRPGIRGLAVQDGAVVAVHTWDLDVEQVTSFGRGDDGELYVLSRSGSVSRLVPGA
ncbi:MAG: sorbosone dehydrogenase family protein [Acidimicrobiia bacterium]